MNVKSIVAVVVLAAGSAWADSNVTVNGVEGVGEWPAQICVADPVGDPGIDVVKSCIENNNTNLYVLVQINAANTGDIYAGFTIDTNKDGIISSADDTYAVHFPPSPAKGGSNAWQTADSLFDFDPTTIINGTFIAKTLRAGCTFSGFRTSTVIELSIPYACVGMTSADETRLIQPGAYPSLDFTQYVTYNGTTDTLVVDPTIPDVTDFTVLASPGQNTLNWTNPSTHGGVLILRSTTGAPAIPDPHQVPASMVFDSGVSSLQTWADTSVTAGTRYYYRIFNYVTHNYSAGNVPAATNPFLDVVTLATGATKPAWVYNVGFTTTQQPYTDFGVAVYSSSNAQSVTSNNISSGAAIVGQEKFRPVPLNGVVQPRVTVIPLSTGTQTYLFTGTQTGHTYAINTTTGAQLWHGNNGNVLGDAIQAQAIGQIYTYTNAAYKTTYDALGVRDLIFFPTRNSTGTTSNEVFALNGADGKRVWEYHPGDMDFISGGVLIDYNTNYLWVASRGGTGGTAQESLRVLNVASLINDPSPKSGDLTNKVPTKVNPATPALKLGNIDAPVIRSAANNEAYVVSTVGKMYGFDLNTTLENWNFQLPSPADKTGIANYPVPVTGGFVVSIPSYTGATPISGKIIRYTETKTNRASPLVATWTAATAGVIHTTLGGATVASPTGVRVDATNGLLYCGDNSGNVHKLDLATGAELSVLNLSTLGLGLPSLDVTSATKRLYVGGNEGKIFAVAVPF